MVSPLVISITFVRESFNRITEKFSVFTPRLCQLIAEIQLKMPQFAQEMGKIAKLTIHKMMLALIKFQLCDYQSAGQT